jgi:hypothetical protein
MIEKRLCLEIFCKACGSVIGHEPYEVQVGSHAPPRWSLLLQAKEWLERERYKQHLYWVADLLVLVEKEMQRLENDRE